MQYTKEELKKEKQEVFSTYGDHKLLLSQAELSMVWETSVRLQAGICSDLRPGQAFFNLLPKGLATKITNTKFDMFEVKDYHYLAILVQFLLK